MLELSNVAYNITKYTTKTQFNTKLNNYLKEANKRSLCEDSYAIICNCNDDSTIKHLKRLGFKEVFNYKGHTQITTLMYYTKQKLSFWEWYRS